MSISDIGRCRPDKNSLDGILKKHRRPLLFTKPPRLLSVDGSLFKRNKQKDLEKMLSQISDLKLKDVKLNTEAFPKEVKKELFTKAKNDATPCTTQGCKLEHPKTTMNIADAQEPFYPKGQVTFETEWEDKTTKPDYTLIPKEALDREVKRMMLGVEKYSRDDWKNTPIEEHKASMYRHLLAYIHGETDEDHLGAARAQSGILCALEAQDD